MSGRPLPDGFRRHRITGAIAIPLVVGVLAGCSGVFENRPDYAHANLAEGVTFACYHDPCTVTFTLPPGDGEHTVRANGRVLGTYPAGTPVDLGAFSREESPVTFTVDGVERSASVLFLLARYQYDEKSPAADE
jgi:hypothetical protein